MIHLLPKDTATKGAIEDVASGYDRRQSNQRISALVIRGVTDDDGAFEFTVPHVSGWVRAILLKGREGDVLTADGTLKGVGVWSPGEIEVAATAEATIADSFAFVNEATESFADTKINALACPLRIEIANAGASKRFTLLIIVKIR